MSGRLVVLDRAGRAGKSFPLAAGLATLGRADGCDIRVLLPAVSPHHATVTVHAHQTVVRNVGSGTTLVNGAPVSVHALRHGDELSLCGRRLRWEYDRAPPAPRRHAVEPALALPTAGAARAARRETLAAAPRRPDRDLQLALELRHRDSMPASSAGGKQVAIVQPQRRDTNDQNDTRSPRLVLAPHRPYGSGDKRGRGRRSSPPAAGAAHPHSSPHPAGRRAPPPRHASLHTPTKASLWIESRRGRGRARSASGSARRAPPLRLAVLRRALTPAAAARARHKVPAPLHTDPTKQAAIMLMAGRTPRAAPAAGGRQRSRSKGNDSVSILEITDSDAGSVRRSRRSSLPSPAPPTARKSALKDPLARSRKTESIKFDLSNLESNDSMVTADDSAESVLLVSDASRRTAGAASEDELTLRYSESPPAPSPRRSIHSRSGRMLHTAGSPLRAAPQPPPPAVAAPDTPASPRSKSSRGSIIVQKALNTSTETNFSDSQYSRRTAASPGSRRTLEAYSVVDLVSGESDASTLSHYGSAASTRFSSLLGASTPLHGIRRSQASKANSARVSRSRIGGSMLASSADEDSPKSARSKASTRLSRSKIVDSILASSADEESPKSARSKVSTRVSRSRIGETTYASSVEESPKSAKSRASTRASRTKAGETSFLSSAEEDSPKSTKSKASSRSRIAFASSVEESPKSARSKANSTRASLIQIEQPSFASSAEEDSPKSVKSKANSTRVSRAQTEESPRSARSETTRASRLGDSNLASSADEQSPKSAKSKGSTRASRGSLVDSALASPKESPKLVKSRASIRASRSLGGVAAAEDASPRSRRPAAAPAPRAPRGSSTPEQRGSPEEASTPVLIRSLLDASVIEPSTRRRTVAPARSVSKRSSARSKSLNFAPRGGEVTPTGTVSIAQDPVKNKHSSAKKSQSRRSIIDTLEDSNFVRELFNSPVKRKLSQSMTEYPKKARRSAAAERASARAPSNRLSDMRGVKELFAAGARDDLTDVRGEPTDRLDDLAGLKQIVRPSSPRNDLRRVTGVGALFKRGSPRNDLANVSGIKDVLQPKSPRNDLRRVSGVRALFREEPRNDLTDVRGVRGLFKRKSPENDLGNVSGVRALKVRSPRNDLRDVRGVRALYKRPRSPASPDVSGVARLLDDEPSASEVLFDRLAGRPVVKATYSKSFTARATPRPRRSRRASLRSAVFPDNVEEWLQKELQERTANKSVSRALQKLSTATVAGATPIVTSRGRSGTVRVSASDMYSAHTLPIKKRSLVKTGNESPAPAKPSLPLKKRALVHSTPLKGRAALSATHDDLGRVSPIPPPSPKVIHVSPKPKNARKSRAVAEAKEEAVKPSPKRTRARRTQEPAPRAPPAAKRAKKPAAREPTGSDGSPAPKAKSPAASGVTKSPVTATKSPAKEPTTRRAKKEKPVPSSPVAPRRTRTKKEPSPKKSPIAKRSPKAKKSPKSKAKRVNFVLPKPSPQLKPRPPARRAQPAPSPKAKNPTKNDKPKAKSPKESPVRARKTRKAPASPVKQSRKRKSEEPEQKVARRRKATTTEPAPKKKGTKAAAAGASPAKRAREASPRPEPAPTRRNPAAGAPEEEPPEGRRARQTEKKETKKSQTAAKKAPKTPTKARAAPKKAVKYVIPKSTEKPSRTRAAPEKAEKPASRKRGAPEKTEKASVVVEKVEKPTRKARAAAATAETAQAAQTARTARTVDKPGRRGAASPQKTEAKPARGKKVASAETAVEAPRGRKRKNEVTSAEKKKEPSPKKPRGRAAAAAAAAGASAAAPRARRR